MLCVAGLEVLVPEGGILLPATVVLLNWMLRPGHFRLLVPLTQQARKGVIVLARVIDLDYQGRLDYFFTMEGRKSVSGI